MTFAFEVYQKKKQYQMFGEENISFFYSFVSIYNCIDEFLKTEKK